MVLGGFRSFHVLVTTPLQLSRPFGNWDHVFPCPNGKVTRPRRLAAQVSCPVMSRVGRLLLNYI